MGRFYHLSVLLSFWSIGAYFSWSIQWNSPMELPKPELSFVELFWLLAGYIYLLMIFQIYTYSWVNLAISSFKEHVYFTSVSNLIVHGYRSCSFIAFLLLQSQKQYTIFHSQCQQSYISLPLSLASWAVLKVYQHCFIQRTNVCFHWLLKLVHLFLIMCTYMGVFKNVPLETRRTHWIPWGCSYRRMWATQPRFCKNSVYI